MKLEKWVTVICEGVKEVFTEISKKKTERVETPTKEKKIK